MSNYLRQVRQFIGNATQRTTQTSAYIPFTPEHVEVFTEETPILPERHYFQIVLNEMYLAKSGRWLSEYDPLLFTVTEFLYNKAFQEVPRVVGTNFLQKYQRNIPQGTRFINSPVTGIHPYSGGNVTFSLVLYRYERANHLRNLLHLMDQITQVIDPLFVLTPYLSIANVIVEGLQLIIKDGKTEPLVAVHHNFLTMEDSFEPGYYALINAPEEEIDLGKLWVREGRLCTGETLADSVPYTLHDFVLFMIVQHEKRNDIQHLPFYPSWQEAQKLATNSESWEDAKLKLKEVWSMILFSPDLTDEQKNELVEQFKQIIQKVRKRAKEIEQLGGITRSEQIQANVKKEILTELGAWASSLN